MKDYKEVNKEITKEKLERIKKTGLNEFAKKKHRCVAEALSFAASKDGWILDIGSRSGFLLDILQEYGFKNFYAVDVCPEAVEYIKSRGYFAEQLDIQEEHLEVGFDTIVVSHVLEHTPYPEKALKNIDKMIMPDGILYIEVPKDQKVREKAGHFSKFTCFSDLDRMFSRKKWKCLYYENGNPIRSLWRRKWNV